MRIRVEDRWEPITLEALGEHFKRTIRADGERGIEKRYGAQVSRIFVEVDAHLAVPWEHVQWILSVCVERGIYKVHLRVRTRTMNMVLPPNAAIEPGAEPRPEIIARVDVLARGTVEARWGPFNVRRPRTVSYRIGGTTTDDLSLVTRSLPVIRKSAEDAGQTDILYGVLRADPTVSVERVLDVLLAFLDAGIVQGDWMGARFPTKSERRRYWLPYPRR